MGDMADFTLNQVMDAEEQRMDYLNGGYSTVEAIELGILDEQGYLHYGQTMPKLKRSTKSSTPTSGKTTPVKTQKSKTVGQGFMGNPPITSVVYGPAGVGKTSFAAQFPHPLFLVDPAEKGILDLLAYRQVKNESLTADDVAVYESADQLTSILTAIGSGLSFATPSSPENEIDPSNYQTLVIDSLTGLQAILWKRCCEEKFDGDFSREGFFSYQAGPENAAQNDFPELIELLIRITDTGKNIVCIAHSDIKPHRRPGTAQFDEYVPSIHKKTWECFNRWVQSVLFLNNEVDFESQTEMKKAGRRKPAPKEADRRLLYCDKSNFWTAKNRYGLPYFIDSEGSAQTLYKNFCDHMVAF